MRCLFCNKKLSLLKLAKGDSFCSPEHFDAYQLQLSKDAFDRLSSVAVDDAPKTPLAVEPKGEARPVPPEQNGALARLSAFVPPALPEVPAPPYAPFASAPLPSFTLNPPYPIASGPETGEAVEPSRALAYPVHEAEDIACILNLYLQLSLSGTAPKDWTPEQRPMDVAPERFRLEITQPPFGVTPEFPEVEDLEAVEVGSQAEDDEDRPELEHLAPIETVPLIEPAAPAVESHSIEAVPVEPETQALIEPSAPLPESEHLAPVEPVLPIEAAAPAVEDHPVEALPFAEAAPSVTPVLPAEPATIAPIEPIESIEQTSPRVPFLAAPSFKARTGTPIRLYNAANSVPHGTRLAPILEKDILARPDSPEGIPNSTRFARSTGFRIQDSTAHINGAPAVAAEPAFFLPKPGEQRCERAWTPSNRQIIAALPPVDATRASLRPVDYTVPAPVSLMVRPDASSLSKTDPRALLAGTSLDVVSIFRGALEIAPLGREPLFIDRRADAVESVWPAIPAPFPARKPLPSAWQPGTSYRALPDPIAPGSESRMPLLEALRYAPGCIKIDRADKARLPAPYTANDTYRAAEWPEADAAFVRVASEPCLVFVGSMMWPHVAAVPKGSLKRSSGDPTLSWEPRLAAPEARRAVKFLPSRDGAILPPAKEWDRLEPVPC